MENPIKKINQYLFTSNSIFLNITFLLIFNNTLFSQTNDYVFVRNNNIIIQYFPNIHFTKEFLEVNNRINCGGRNITKRFQMYKLHLFNAFF